MTTVLKLLAVIALAAGIAGGGASYVEDANAAALVPTPIACAAIPSITAPGVMLISSVAFDVPAATAPATPAPAAPADVVPSPETDAAGFASAVLERARKSEWLPLIGCVLMLLAWGLRKLLAGALKIKWVGTTWGGRVVAFGSSLALAVGAAAAAREPVNMGLLATAAAAAWVAAGQWEDRKDLARSAKGG